MQPQRNDQPTPPPQFPPAAPPQLYVSPPARQEPPKKRLSIVWVVLAIIAIPVFGEQLLFGQPHSGVQYQGQELSQTDAKSALQDIAAMTSHVRAGDPTSFDMSYQPTTDIGQRFKALVINAQEVQAAYAKGIKDSHSPDYLSPKELGNAAGRKEARRIHDKFSAATKAFRAGTAKYQEDMADLASELSATHNSHLQEFKTQDAELAELDNEQMASIENLIDFVDAAKPGYDAKNEKLNFSTDADVAKYKSIYKEIIQKERTLIARRAQIMEDRQAIMRQAMTAMQGYAK